MELPINQVICGDSVEVMKDFPADSIDLVVTSPPYWGLRDYGIDGQIGLEDHPQKYIDELVNVARQIRRVLKKSGSFYLNLGDTYFSTMGNNSTFSKDTTVKGSRERRHYEHKIKQSNWLQPKQLMLIPSRVAIALQEDGWILRNDIVWYKPNHMPSSGKDRLTCSWEHVFHFVKSRKYFYDLDAIRKPHKLDANQMEYRKKLWASRGKDTTFQFSKEKRQKSENGYAIGRRHSGYFDADGSPRFNLKGKNPGDVRKIETTAQFFIEKGSGGNVNLPSPEHPKGKNPGDFWKINTQPFKGAHFAVFPEKLIGPIVKAGCPEWICRKCGKPRTRITKRVKLKPRIINGAESGIQYSSGEKGFVQKGTRMGDSIHETIGFSDCGCGAGFHGGIVLDPMCGSGTALLVAHKLGRRWIGIDLKQDYVKMAKNRLTKECSQHLGDFCG